MNGVIAFQGQPGAYSDLACRTAYPALRTLPCESFEAAIEAVRDGRAELAMLPCENTLAGRVPDIHHLLPESGLFVVGEAFQRVEHCLLAAKGASVEGLKRAHSHSVALGQVRHFLRRLGIRPVVQADTAGAAQLVAKWNNPEDAAIASSLAAEIYGLRGTAGECRGRGPQHNAVLCDGASPANAGCDAAQSDDDVRVPRPQRAGRAVQGAGRVSPPTA